MPIEPEKVPMCRAHLIRSLIAALFAAFLVVGATGACGEHSVVAQRPILFSADLAPRVSGEIYKVALNGKRTDLSRSLYADTGPVISPDGKRVAFLSGRAGYPAIYVVGINGRGLKLLSPNLGGPGPFSWSSDGTQLAAVLRKNESASLYLLAPDRKPRLLYRETEIDNVAWSPNGRLIAYECPNGCYGDNKYESEIKVVTPSGKHVFTVPGSDPPGPQWSSTGQLAVQGSRRVRVYDQRGRLLARPAGQTFAFSPDGKRLATVLGHELVVRDGGGAGRVILREPAFSTSAKEDLGDNFGPQLDWLGENKIAIVPLGPVDRTEYESQHTVGVDVPSGHVGSVPYRVWLSWQSCQGEEGAAWNCGSPDHSLVAETLRVHSQFELRVERVDGSGMRRITHVPGCLSDGYFEPAIDSLQFTSGNRALVYESDCVELYGNIYSISPGGSNLRRLTRANRNQMEPELSPDGHMIALSQARWVGQTCGGCASTIRVMDADGKHPRQLTFERYSNWDGPAIWSSDEREVLYLHSTQDSSIFYDIPAGGGRPQRLNKKLNIRGSEQTLGPYRIAYLDDDEGALWTVGLDGKNRQRVTSTPSDRGPFVSSPAWSRDGRLAWLSTTGNEDRYTLEMLTRTGRRYSYSLGDLAASDLAWSPDGRSLALVASPPEGPSDIYTISDDGTQITRITSGLGANSVSWR
jgi:Tol biopolymer transport system component